MEKDEGEFKKCLIEHWKSKDGFDEDDSQYSWNDFKQILVEAKKEFPTMESVQNEVGKDNPLVWLALANKRHDWFVKWFGGEKNGQR